MKLIHYRGEIDYLHWGINLRTPDERTAFEMIVVIPLPYLRLEDYDSFDTWDRRLGLQVWSLLFGLRIRRIAYFKEHGWDNAKKYLKRWKTQMRAVGRQELLWTREEWEDKLVARGLRLGRGVCKPLNATARAVG